MKFRTILGTAAAAAMLATASAASADDWHHNDHHGSHGPAHHRVVHRAYIAHDRVFSAVRGHGYRYVGNPYISGGHYVVRAYDHRGRLVLASVDPYSGAWLGFTLVR
ncbi:MAG TPA: hypothetical protein VGM36_04065 [Rhizomicrobium sp.]|jgi:hypothetical protein